MIIHAFKKCGITTNVDGSENCQVNIRGLEDYVMPVPEEGVTRAESEDEECVTDKDNNDNNNCDKKTKINMN